MPTESTDGNVVGVVWRSSASGGEAVVDASGSATIGSTVFVAAAAPPKSVIGTWSRAADTARILGAYAFTTAAVQNNEVVYDVDLDAGTYSFGLLTVRADNLCIYTLLIDDVAVGTIDSYAAATANYVGEITGIVVAERGRHEVTLKAATKNASSLGYGMNLSGFTFTRTGA